MPGAGDDLSALFDPAAVAVVGASDDRLKWGHWLAVRALRGAGRRDVHLVNRRGGEVLGRPAHRSLLELPGPVELAVLSVPAAALEQSVDDAIAAGARAIVAITGGEQDGDAGGARDAAIAARVRAAGVRLLGPNCLGVFDAGAELELVSNDLPRGAIGLISQSGNLALEIGGRAAAIGLGFSRFASLGNQVDLQAAELVRALALHEPTRLIALYAEDLGDGRGARRGGRGGGRRGQAGAPAHRRALRGDRARGPLAHGRARERRARGRGRVRGRGDPARALAARAGRHRRGAPAPPPRARPPRGRAGRRRRPRRRWPPGSLTRPGMEVPALEAGLVARLRADLPAAAAASNPVDMAGGGEQDVSSFGRLAGRCWTRARSTPCCSRATSAATATTRTRCARSSSPPPRRWPPRCGRPAARSSSTACTRAGRRSQRCAPAACRCTTTSSARSRRWRRRLPAPPRRGVPALPPPAAPVADRGYAATRSLLEAAGVPFVPAATVTDADAAARAAAAIGYPVALKALGLLHKSDAGGVVLGLADEAALRAAVAGLTERLRPPALSVERMAPVGDGVELIAGTSWEPRVGPLVMVGLGGIHAETLRDVRVALAPVDADDAEALLRSLRGAQLLLGARGRPVLDVRACAEAVAALSRVAAAHPELAELEVNPLLALPEGALALDARAV